MQENKYNPKYYREDEPWETDSWQTGSTEPPRNKSGVTALLLILVIFLCGIITVLGILNVRLFTQLKSTEEANASIRFIPEDTLPETALAEIAAASEIQDVPETTAACSGEDISLCIQESPTAPPNIPDPSGLSLQEIYQKNIPSVVSITTKSITGGSTGTGVILSEKGYIVTNAHVLENASSVSIRLTDDRVFQANLIGADEITDLAVLFIEAEDLIPAQFGDSTMLQVGDSVTAIGDPLGSEFRGSFTDGIISAINRDVAIEGRTMSLIQTNAALNSGNSGSPLINSFGQVIGINTMKIGAFTDRAGVEGLGFAIPSATVKDVVDQLIKQGYVSGRPTLGLVGDTLSTFYQRYYRMPAGLYITDVDADSSAAAVGIEPGDILLTIDDTRILTMEDLNTVLYNHSVGDTVSVLIYRGGQQYNVELTLSENKG